MYICCLHDCLSDEFKDVYIYKQYFVLSYIARRRLRSEFGSRRAFTHLFISVQSVPSYIQHIGLHITLTHHVGYLYPVMNFVLFLLFLILT